MRRRDRAQLETLLPLALAALWCAAAALTAFAVVSGEPLQWGAVRVSLRNASRPFLALAVLTLLLVHLCPARALRVRDRVRAVATAIPQWCVAVLLAAVVGVVGWRLGSDVAAGADSYGYITQAEMLSAGHLRRAESALAAGARWPNSRHSLAPLGWLPAAAGWLVPIYPPGYPLLMAGLRRIHPQAMFALVPVAGAATLAAVIALARAIGRRDVGVPAAILLASSPAFLMSLVVPMSDLPATAAWAVATALAMGGGSWTAIGAGAAGGLALLIRPNLLPLSIGLLAIAATQRDRRQRHARLMLVAAGLGAGAGLVAACQWAYYGSPTANGYGRVDDLFSLRHWRINVVQFTGWLLESHPKAVLVAAVVGAVYTRRPDALGRRSDKRSMAPPSENDIQAEVAGRPQPAGRVSWDGHAASSRLWLLPALTFACYVLYLPFDNWTYLRFLLPALPVMMLWAAMGIRHVAGQLREPMPSYACTLAFAWCALAGVHEARVRNVFANAASVERFRSIPFEVARTLPPRPVVITREFSGSLQYYAQVDTLRWDWLDTRGLEQAVRTLQSQQRQVFALLDLRSEAPEFERNHRGGGTSLRLEHLHTFSGTVERVALYRVTDDAASATDHVSRP